MNDSQQSTFFSPSDDWLRFPWVPYWLMGTRKKERIISSCNPITGIKLWIKSSSSFYSRLAVWRCLERGQENWGSFNFATITSFLAEPLIFPGTVGHLPLSLELSHCRTFSSFITAASLDRLARKESFAFHLHSMLLYVITSRPCPACAQQCFPDLMGIGTFPKRGRIFNYIIGSGHYYYPRTGICRFHGLNLLPI